MKVGCIPLNSLFVFLRNEKINSLKYSVNVNLFKRKEKLVNYKQIVESNFQFQDVFSIICNPCKPARSDISIAELFSQLLL